MSYLTKEATAVVGEPMKMCRMHLTMTKLDGTAKGGILIAVAKKYKLPIIAVGLGEKEDDLQIFDAEKFANAFIETN